MWDCAMINFQYRVCRCFCVCDDKICKSSKILVLLWEIDININADWLTNGLTNAYRSCLGSSNGTAFLIKNYIFKLLLFGLNVHKNVINFRYIFRRGIVAVVYKLYCPRKNISWPTKRTLFAFFSCCSL